MAGFLRNKFQIIFFISLNYKTPWKGSFVIQSTYLNFDKILKSSYFKYTLNYETGFVIQSNILLTEDLPNIPRNSKGKEIKGRKQLEAGLEPNQYLETLKTNPNYRDEVGMTPKDQIIYAIKHLERTNQVIDDWQGKGSISYQLGAYFPSSGDVPSAGWYRDNRQASLSWRVPGYSDSGRGVRAAVRVPA